VITLAFDTATPSTAVAVLRRDGRAIETRHDPAPGERPGHASRLLSLVEQALADAELGWDDVERLAVGTGPGTFTGLRIGIATARALAQARGIPLVGVSTLRALAEGVHEALPEAGCVVALLDARRGEAFAAAWTAGDERLAPVALGPEELARRVAELGPGALSVGDGAVRFRSTLERAGAVVPADGSPMHRVAARHLCRLAAGAPEGSLDAVLPDYVRLPDAQLPRQRRDGPT
jgi:tRNA threonylcarbamoyladenosine biosynthesis protein TsaB